MNTRSPQLDAFTLLLETPKFHFTLNETETLVSTRELGSPISLNHHFHNMSVRFVGDGLSLIRQANKFRRNIAVSTLCGSHRFTYAQLLRDSGRLASQLSGPGTRIGVFCPPGYDFIRLMYAVWRAGACAVPFCISHPISELRYVCEDAQVSTVLTVKTTERTPDLNQAIQHIPNASLLSLSPTLIADSDQEYEFEALSSVDADIDPDNLPALIIYTSGTTGKPKGAVHLHRNLLAQIQCLVDAWEWNDQDKILNALPLHHVHGLVNVCLLVCLDLDPVGFSLCDMEWSRDNILAKIRHCPGLELFEWFSSFDFMDGGSYNVFQVARVLWTCSRAKMFFFLMYLA